jgi:2'-5' RNA ligase
VNRYPLISYLDTDLTAKVRALQHKLRDLTGSQASLRDWDPHLTVGSEIWLDDQDLDAYAEELAHAANDIKPFKVQIYDFGFIDNWSGGKLPGNTPYGVYLHVEVTAELRQLIEALAPVTAKHRVYYQLPRPYLLHVTLAFRDLNKEGYQLAKETLAGQTFSEDTLVDSFSIAKMNPSGRNVEARRIPLAP